MQYYVILIAVVVAFDVEIMINDVDNGTDHDQNGADIDNEDYDTVHM